MAERWTPENMLNLFVRSTPQTKSPARIAPNISKLLHDFPDLPPTSTASKEIYDYLQQYSDATAITQERPKISPLREAFRQSASVLSCFDPSELKPLRMPAEPGEAVKQLIEDLVEVYEPPTSRQRWMLRPDVREQVLRESGSREQLIAALNANGPSIRPSTLLQGILEFYIKGVAEPQFESMSLEVLMAHLQAARWLQPSSLILPAPEKIQEIIDQHEVPAVFEKMAGKNFVGRETELQLLRDFVEVLPASTKLSGLRRQIRRWLGIEEKSPLVIYAAGGVGKTTLISKFLLDHMQVPEELKFPYIYLDFDNPRLSLNDPNTILTEAIRQLSVQYPNARKTLEQFLHGERVRSVHQQTDRSDTILDSKGAAREVEAAGSVSRFARLVSQIIRRSSQEGDYSVPLLIVLDTYEEVQYRGFKQEIQLWNLMDSIQKEFPTLRIIVFGRAPLEQVPTSSTATTIHQLANFDQASAEAFLKRLGVEDSSVASNLYNSVGGNPLSLKLAAEIYRREGVQPGLVSKGWRDSFLFFSASEALVQGQLYQRILNHIHDGDVRKIAHPGLVLRRITPELIKEVLQGPCGVIVADNYRAQQLFDALGREVALVTMESDGALSHRADLRRIMLSYIRRDKPQQTEEINRLAVDYYSRKQGLPALAEQIYHRLQLCQSEKEINSIWEPGVEEFLRGAIEELPVESKPILASYLGIRLKREDLEAAGIAEWERYTARSANELVKLGHYEQALGLLHERKERTKGSPLHLIEARALASTDHWSAANKVVHKALEAASVSGNRKEMLDSMLLAAEILQNKGEVDKADDYFEQAGNVAATLNDQRNQILAMVQRMKLRRKPKRVSELETLDLSRRLAELLGALPDNQWRENKRLVRASVSLLGLDYPDFILRMLRRIGIGELDKKQISSLAGIVKKLQQESAEAKQLIDDFAKTLRIRSASVEKLMFELQKSQRLDEFLEKVFPIILKQPDLSEQTGRAFAGLYLRETLTEPELGA